MTKFLRGILATMIGLAALVIIERSFGMKTAMIATGIGFVGYVLWITVRQMREEDDEDDGRNQ